MNDRQHRQIAAWERRWLAFSGVMTLTFVMLIAYNLATEGAHVAQRTTKATPEQILAQEVFREPGVRQLAPGKVQVTTVARAFAFAPADVRVPVGVEVEFYLTAADVIHGYQIERTNVNFELIPGEISTLRYTFRRPGVYRITCNEYCGIGHHEMLGTITVVPASQWHVQGAGRPEEPGAGGASADADATPDGASLDGASLYAANCVACHQANGRGIPGAFPPLAGHAPELIVEQGRDYLPLVMVYGLQGPIEVAGASYAGVMPAWAQLSDAELAAVSNHILSAWDEGAMPADFRPYQPVDFAEARGLGLSSSDVHQRRSE